MKRNLSIFVSFLFFASCAENRDTKIVKDHLQSVPNPNTANFVLSEIDAEDFKIVEKGDTTYYLTQVDEGIDGKPILFNSDKFKNISSRIKFIFGFLQYTTDDIPAFPLKYKKETNWYNLEVTKNQILIPDFLGNTNRKRIFQLLNFSDNKQLEKWVASENLTQLKLESLKEQKYIYTNLLNNKSKYATCCPEYIKQAESFLKKSDADFQTVADLGLELTINKIEIEIKGYLKDGTPFTKIISDSPK